MRLSESLQVVVGIAPVDLAAAANSGDWISLKAYNDVAVMVVKGAGTAGQDPILTIEQARNINGLDAKPLLFERIHVKQGLQSDIGQFTSVSQEASHTFTSGGVAAQQALWIIEFGAAQLDINGGFDCLRATVADTGASAQIGTVLYLLAEPRYATIPLPSAITD